MAIAWEEQTGLKYLKKNDAAICITNQNKIEEKLKAIFEQPNIVSEYALKAYNLSIKNHKKELVQNELYETLLAKAKKDEL
jgi:UDP-N-acetylglucosamine:LPS N-acetylglucosamine transferase